MDVEKALGNLIARQAPDGGWAYFPGQKSRLEPTCLALLALSLAGPRYQSAMKKAWQAIEQAEEEGAYIEKDGRDATIWLTSLVLFVQSALTDDENRIERTAARLLSMRGRIPDEASGELQDIDITLRGWSWAENNFSWVEPTSWACLALRRAGFGRSPEVEEGLRLLVDRTHDDGGVNCGNRHILGGRVEPIPGPTALMLLALQGVGFDGDRAVIPEANDGRQAPLHPRTVASVRYLQEQAQSCSDLEYLCWMILAFDLYREIDGLAETIRTLESRIEEVADQQVRSDIFQPSIVRDVLLILAHCTGQRNVFRLPADRPQRKIEARQVCRRRSFSQRVKSYFRGLCIEAANRLKPTPDVAGVHIAAVDSYEQDLADVLRRQYQHFRERVPLKGKRVVLKPNLVEYRRNRVINTHPHVVAAAIELCKHEGASDIIVAEGPGHWRNVQYLVCESGLGEVLKHYHVPFVDINHDETAKVLNLGQLTGLEYLFFSQTIMTADVVISLPKMKTHHWAGATLAMKNFFGVLSGVYYGWPKNELHWRGIDNSIVDICATRPPDLAIVDGIVGMEGDGPLNGTPKHVGVIVMGTDSVAVDATCCRLMQLDPEKIPYLVMAADRKLGQLRESAIEQLGDRIIDRAQPFETIEMFRHLQIRPVEVA